MSRTIEYESDKREPRFIPPHDRITFPNGAVLTFPPGTVDVAKLWQSAFWQDAPRGQQAQWDPQLISPRILRKEARTVLEQARATINAVIGRGPEQRQLGTEAQAVLDKVNTVLDGFINELRDE